MKVLIIGYGSIGKRHEGVLSQFKNIKTIDIVTKQNLDNKNTFLSLKKVTNLNSYDYFIISSPTNKHFKQLKYIESKVSNKIIFCEKPLFKTDKKLKIKNNSVYIGYVLRFHPLLLKLKKILNNEKILSANTSCGQYLPTWRPDSDYKKSYSASKEQGGGVLLDLSHEIDYIEWLFGGMKEIKSYQRKISDLEIDSDDYLSLIAITKKDIFINLNIDYISKITHRTIKIDTIENSYTLDFIKNTLLQKNKNGVEKKYNLPNLERNYMFKSMHKDILNKKKNICTFREAKNVMKTISTIQEQNNG